MSEWETWVASDLEGEMMPPDIEVHAPLVVQAFDAWDAAEMAHCEFGHYDGADIAVFFVRLRGEGLPQAIESTRAMEPTYYERPALHQPEEGEEWSDGD